MPNSASGIVTEEDDDRVMELEVPPRDVVLFAVCSDWPSLKGRYWLMHGSAISFSGTHTAPSIFCITSPAAARTLVTCWPMKPAAWLANWRTGAGTTVSYTRVAALPMP